MRLWFEMTIELAGTTIRASLSSLPHKLKTIIASLLKEHPDRKRSLLSLSMTNHVWRQICMPIIFSVSHPARLGMRQAKQGDR